MLDSGQVFAPSEAGMRVYARIDALHRRFGAMKREPDPGFREKQAVATAGKGDETVGWLFRRFGVLPLMNWRVKSTALRSSSHPAAWYPSLHSQDSRQHVLSHGTNIPVLILTGRVRGWSYF